MSRHGLAILKGRLTQPFSQTITLLLIVVDVFVVNQALDHTALDQTDTMRVFLAQEQNTFFLGQG